MSTTNTVSPNLLTPTEPTMTSLKGEIRKCHACKNTDLPAPKRIFCRFCLTNGYVAHCLPCNGTGSVTSVAAWDGKSKHGSTCLSCGGVGCIPARLKEFELQEQASKSKTA